MENAKLAEAKARLRADARAARRAMPEAHRAAESAALCARLLGLPEVAATSVVLAFWPGALEPDVRLAVRVLAGRGVAVGLPAVVGAGALAWRRFEGEARLVPGAFGLLEPPADAPPLDPTAADVILVPALAAGRDGTRLGAGGGFYDRALPALSAHRVGVVWADALSPTVAAGPLDARLDAVVSGREALRVRNRPDGPA